MGKRIVPAIGEHLNVCEEVYHGQWDACSNSLLNEMKRSAAHCRYAMEQPHETTESMELGSAVHALVLQSDRAMSMIAISDFKTRNSKGSIACAAANPGKIILHREQLDEANRLAAAVMKHPAARFLIESAQRREVSMAWDHPVVGTNLSPVRCKGRIDFLCDRASTIGDLKTTTDAGPDAFQRAIWDYGYHRQADMYLDGQAKLGHAYDHFAFIAIEKEPPYLVAVYRITEEALERARTEREELLERFAECKASGNWPGYSDEVRDITLPAWAWGKAITTV